MPPRQQVNTNLGTVQRTPAARPVDAFERPAESGALGLAKALQGFRSSLSQYTAVANAQWRDEQIDEAEAQAELLTEFKTYQEAVEKGVLKGTETPIFKQTFNERKGRLAGHEYHREINRRYQEELLPNIDDDTDINSFIAQAREEFLGDSVYSAQFTSGFGQVAAGFETSLANRFREDRHKALVIQTEDAIAEEVRAVILAGEAGLEDGQSLSDVVDLTNIERMQGVLTGAELNELMNDTVVGLAIETRNDDMLALLMQPRADGTPGPGNTTQGRRVIREAELRIENLQRSDFNYQQQLNSYQKTQEKDTAFTEAANLLGEDPRADLTDLLLKYPQYASSINSLRNAAIAQKETADPDQLNQVWLDVFDGRLTDSQEITDRVVAAGGSVADVRTTLDLVQSTRNRGASDPYREELNQAVSRVRELTAGAEKSVMSIASGSSGRDVQKMWKAERMLKEAYFTQMRAWEEEGQLLSPSLVVNWLYDQVDAILKLPEFQTSNSGPDMGSLGN